MKQSALVVLIALLVVPGITLAEENNGQAQPSFLDRAQTQRQGQVVVKAAVPSAEETRELFGVSLYRRNVQPVWLEVSNEGDELLQFLSVGMDSWYFTPIESATVGASGKVHTEMKRLFRDQAMGAQIEPGGTRSGFVFTRLDQGTKSFNVDFYVNRDEVVSFTFFIPVPGLRIDHHNVDWDNLYPESEMRDMDKAGLIKALEEMPCCTTDKKAKGSGDPLNLVVMGQPNDVYYAFIRAGWDETEVISASSMWKMAKSFVGGSENRYSPVSGLYVFGRPQDVAFQKARDNINERNHLRLWLTPLRFEGVPVWIGQISRDIGVRLTRKTITTHKVDPEVDETREYLLENLAYSQALAKVSYVRGVGAASIEEPRGNLTGDPYFTDGLRVVLWVARRPTDIADIEALDLGVQPER